MPVTAILLAGGSSSRLGRPKQLLVVDGETLVHRMARIAAAVAPIVVVVPPDARIRSAVEGLDVHIIENPDAAEGIASSIRCGVSACHGDVILVLCDQPRITSAHLQALIDAGAPIAATGYRGIAGVPAFFSAEFRDELLALRGDAGARKIIEAHRDRVVVVPLEEAAIDIDTIDDLRHL